MTVEASGDQALHPQHQVTGRRDLVWSTFISLEDMVQKSISNQVKPFSFSTSVRPRKKKENLGLEINAAKSYIICLLCKYRDPRLEKVILKKAISSCGDSRCSSVSTVLSSWPCLFPVFVWLLLLLAPHCWERLNSRPALTCLWGFTKHQLTVWTVAKPGWFFAVLLPFIASQRVDVFVWRVKASVESFQPGKWRTFST